MKQKNGPVKAVNINGFLYLGVILVAATAVLSNVFPAIPKAVTAILYVVGVIALVLYMWEIQYRRRTGDYHDGGSSAKGKKAKKRK